MGKNTKQDVIDLFSLMTKLREHGIGQEFIEIGTPHPFQKAILYPSGGLIDFSQPAEYEYDIKERDYKSISDYDWENYYINPRLKYSVEIGEFIGDISVFHKNDDKWVASVEWRKPEGHSEMGDSPGSALAALGNYIHPDPTI